MVGADRGRAALSVMRSNLAALYPDPLSPSPRDARSQSVRQHRALPPARAVPRPSLHLHAVAPPPASLRAVELVSTQGYGPAKPAGGRRHALHRPTPTGGSPVQCAVPPPPVQSAPRPARLRGGGGRHARPAPGFGHQAAVAVPPPPPQQPLRHRPAGRARPARGRWHRNCLTEIPHRSNQSRGHSPRHGGQRPTEQRYKGADRGTDGGSGGTRPVGHRLAHDQARDALLSCNNGRGIESESAVVVECLQDRGTGTRSGSVGKHRNKQRAHLRLPDPAAMGCRALPERQHAPPWCARAAQSDMRPARPLRLAGRSKSQACGVAVFEAI